MSSIEIHENPLVAKRIQAVKDLCAYRLEVGIFRSSGWHLEANAPVVAVAATHIFGARVQNRSGNSVTIPPRDFLRGTWEAHEPAIRLATADIVKTLMPPSRRYSGRAALRELGDWYVDKIKETIVSGRPGVWPDLAPYTKEIKEIFYPNHVDDKLIGSEQMMDSIDKRVRRI